MVLCVGLCKGNERQRESKEFDSEVFALELYACAFRVFIPFLKILTNVVKTPRVCNVAFKRSRGFTLP